ncbi:MAG: ABC transporter permease [Acidobacteria bacterium]|nr:ABC transporter permease [Acidobacteriota bacterium]MCI0663344.1 ABC transporter permease [Acidobacteriota bacterium]
MKFLRLIWLNAVRNRRRSILTVLSIALSLFLMTTLLTVVTELERVPAAQEAALRLVTRNAISLANPLPIAYQQQIDLIPGVATTMQMQWFGGVYVDESNFFAQFGCEPRKFARMYPEYRIDPAQLSDFVRDRTGCLAGRILVDRYGWKIGDRITLQGRIFPVDLQLTIRAIYDGEDTTALFFDQEYLNESLKSQGDADYIGTIFIMAKSAEDVPRIMDAVDEKFRNSLAQTKTETERAFQLSFVSMLGNIKTLIISVSSVIVFTILLVVANSMGMSIRERTTEIAVLKTMGFRNRLVLILLVSESLLLGLIAWLLGSVGARMLYNNLDYTKINLFFIGRLEVTPNTVLIGFGVAMLIAFASTIVPAYRAAKMTIATALRNV